MFHHQRICRFMLDFFLYTRFEILYSNFFYISLATPSAKKKKKQKETKTQQSKKVKDAFKLCMKENGKLVLVNITLLLF